MHFCLDLCCSGMPSNLVKLFKFSLYEKVLIFVVLECLRIISKEFTYYSPQKSLDLCCSGMPSNPSVLIVISLLIYSLSATNIILYLPDSYGSMHCHHRKFRKPYVISE